MQPLGLLQMSSLIPWRLRCLTAGATSGSQEVSTICLLLTALCTVNFIVKLHITCHPATAEARWMREKCRMVGATVGGVAGTLLRPQSEAPPAVMPRTQPICLCFAVPALPGHSHRAASQASMSPAEHQRVHKPANNGLRMCRLPGAECGDWAAPPDVRGGTAAGREPGSVLQLPLAYMLLACTFVAPNLIARCSQVLTFTDIQPCRAATLMQCWEHLHTGSLPASPSL